MAKQSTFYIQGLTTLKVAMDEMRESVNRFGQQMDLGPAPKVVPKFATVEEAEEWLLLERARQRTHQATEAQADAAFAENFVGALTKDAFDLLPPPPPFSIHHEPETS